MTNKDFKDFATSVVYHIDFENYFKTKEQSLIGQWKVATDTETREKLHNQIRYLEYIKTDLINLQENI